MADEKEEVVENPDIHFEPVVDPNTLPQLEKIALEEDEEELFKFRARLYRYDMDAEPAEWKERGTGDVKILKHNKTNLCRILMRREKTLKVCANHHIKPEMELRPNCGSEKAWVWSTAADIADDEVKAELLAIKFASAEIAQKFKAKFEEAQSIVKDATEDEEKEEEKSEEAESKEDKETEDVAEKLKDMSVKGDEEEKDRGDGDSKADQAER